MLKRMLASTVVLALLALPLAAQAVAPKPAGDEMTITGQVIDVNCNTTMGAAGPGHKACAETCAKAGEPLAILASDGTIYMPVSSKPGDPQNPRLLPFAEGKVKVTGTHRTNHGLHTIEIKTGAQRLLAALLRSLSGRDPRRSLLGSPPRLQPPRRLRSAVAGRAHPDRPAPEHAGRRRAL
ncbi:MAG: hypothetical protein AUH42_03740 [Gemmatimonadetes bacterium 13_1_40CM_70_11]|nr:MAG: hypothetical protein AUH42_03740 [Gemmatimonadetes bacterium 13_1_40CM_70_11]